MKFSTLTDIGLVRSTNQDSSAVLPFDDNILVMVCDGIGGAKAGEVASFECINYFKNRLLKGVSFKSLNDVKDFMSKEIQICNKYVSNIASKNIEYDGMGTTLCGYLFTTFGNICFNVGDSRCYGYKDNNLSQLTKDHSLVNDMVDSGEITKEEAINHPKRNYLTSAIGIWSTIKVEIKEIEKYDYYLVCSDGLHAYCSEKEILNIFNTYKDIDLITKELVGLALLKGGHDNVTVVVGN